MLKTYKNNKLISFVLGTYNRKQMLELTINSIKSEVYNLSSEIIVIDGGSTDGTINWLTNQKDIISIIQHNRGEWKGEKIVSRSWGYFMNLGFKCAQGKYICMLSDDCILVQGAIKNGIRLFEEKLKQGQNVGACAFYYRSWPGEKKYFVSKIFNKTINVNHGLFLREALEKVNYIDEGNYSFYFGDIDLSLRINAADYTIIDSPSSFVEHTEHADIFVRKSNISKSDADFNKFKEIWGVQFPQMQKNSILEKKEIDFIDAYNTVKTLSLFNQLKRGNFKYAFARLKRLVRIRERISKLKSINVKYDSK
jgi:GT2 family glycosyltransferase